MPAPIRPAVFVGARLLDGRSQDSIADGVLVTGENGRIVAAGSAAAITVPKDADRVDAAGLTILPASSTATSISPCAWNRSTTRCSVPPPISSSGRFRPVANSSRPV